MRRTLTTIVGVLVGAIGAFAPACPSAAAEGAGADGGLELAFPDVEGWEHTPPRSLPAASGGGYSVGYNAEDGTAVTIYIYNRGLEHIPDDLDGEAVRRELEGAKAAVLELKRRGLYDEVREEEAGRSTLGDRPGGRAALYARFGIKLRGRAGVSEIYVLPYRDHFIKLRVTRPAEPPADEADRAPLAELYAGLNDMLGGEGEKGDDAEDGEDGRDAE